VSVQTVAGLFAHHGKERYEKDDDSEDNVQTENVVKLHQIDVDQRHGQVECPSDPLDHVIDSYKENCTVQDLTALLSFDFIVLLDLV